MKKIIALLLACMMVLGLFAGCATAPAGEEATTTTTAPATPAEPTAVTLTVWAPAEDQTEENPWLKTMCDSHCTTIAFYNLHVFIESWHIVWTYCRTSFASDAFSLMCYDYKSLFIFFKNSYWTSRYTWSVFTMFAASCHIICKSCSFRYTFFVNTW